MDQQSKLDKIASAKKKLKEYQSKRDSNKSKDSPSPNLTPTPTNVFHIDPAEEMTFAGNVSEVRNDIDIVTQNQMSATNDESPVISPSMAISSLESLNQLSARVNSLMKDELAVTATGATVSDNYLLRELEVRNQELANALQTEKFRNDELSIKVRDLNSTIDRLNIDIDRLKVENSTKIKVETAPLQDQLKTHIQTIGILVGEKAELQAFLKEYQNAVKEKRTENEELQTRLRASRFRVSELEREVKNYKDTMGSDNSGKTIENHNQLILETQRQVNTLTSANEELKEEVLELKQKINLKNEEIVGLRTDIERKASEINMANLKIEQLSAGQLMDGLNMDSRLESLSQQNLAKERQVNELKNLVEQLGTERDQSNAQYQSYVLQLNKEVASLSEKLLKMTEENEKLSKRELELVRHVADLEKQIQQQISKQKHLEKNAEDAESQNLSQKIHELETKLIEVSEKLNASELQLKETKIQLEANVVEKTKLKSQLDEKIDQISALEITVERIQTDNPDSGKLIAEIESHKVTASRAMTQNAELKSQLEEMQNAYVQLSNDKLELTDKLQSEQHLCREMRTTYTAMEEELKKTKEHLHLKDEEMIRLAHETTELNKQVLLKDQELDRLRHYESGSDNVTILQREFENAKEIIEKQRQRIAELEQNSESTDELSIIEEGRFAMENEELMKEIETLQSEKQELLKVINDFQSKIKTPSKELNETDAIKIEIDTEIQKTLDSITQHEENNDGTDIKNSIPVQEALEKLQDRFRNTMNKVAELTDEKQRLEHLVAQLQFETETIGEYITLYQNQRRQLKHKDLERDIQLRNLAIDREKMKEKLMELNSLIEQLLTEKRRDRLISASSENEEMTYVNGNADSDKINENENNKTDVAPTKEKAKATATKILSLLSDIQSANQTHFGQTPGVDHCSCCSGKLEVV